MTMGVEEMGTKAALNPNFHFHYSRWRLPLSATASASKSTLRCLPCFTLLLSTGRHLTAIDLSPCLLASVGSELALLASLDCGITCLCFVRAFG